MRPTFCDVLRESLAQHGQGTAEEIGLRFGYTPQKAESMVQPYLERLVKLKIARRDGDVYRLRLEKY